MHDEDGCGRSTQIKESLLNNEISNRNKHIILSLIIIHKYNFLCYVDLQAH